MSPVVPTEFHFRGSGTVLRPNHITRYIYPSLIYPKEYLILQSPQNSTKRPRPQGQSAYDTTFLTITQAPKPCPDRAQFQAWLVAEKAKDRKSKNALGRAMRRVTGFPGNTILECGKFRLRGPRVVFVIRRTTVLALGGKDKGRFERDKDIYEIPAEGWRAMMPQSTEPDAHDCWWVRLHSHDRAYWNVQEKLDELGIAEPIRQWLPRQDIMKLGVKIIYDPARFRPADDFDRDCIACCDEYFTKADFPVQLPCKHFICVADVIHMHDNADGKLTQDEQDPGFPFWRCPMCRHIMPVKYNRLDMIHNEELPFWRWKTMHDFMQAKMTDRDFNTYLVMAEQMGYIPSFPMDQNDGAEVAVITVRYADVVAFVEKFVIPVAALLPWGYTTDNPVTFVESQCLLNQIKAELKRLESHKKKFRLKELIEHLKFVSLKAFNPVVMPEKHRLGNPTVPPGYERYRKYLCEWTARGCFLPPQLVMGHFEFVKRMATDKGVWWKGHVFLKG